MSALRRVSEFSHTIQVDEDRRVFEWRCEQFNGRIAAYIDGLQVLDERLPLVDFSLTKRFDIVVVGAQHHTLTVEMTRKIVLAGFRPMSYRLLMDERLVAAFEC